MRPDLPIVAISVGDPAGIGPEIAAKALAEPDLYDCARPLVVSDLGVMREAIRFSNLSLDVRAVDDASIDDPSAGKYEPGVLDVLDMRNVDLAALEYGTIAAESGRAAFECVRKVIELALAGKVHATVTGPIHKESINLAGFHYAGHTEIYADLTGTKDYTMMLADGPFRVVHVSTHCALREACDRVKKERVLKVIELGCDALKKLGIAGPRIAVAGLNPHCGEGGLFGREDVEEIRPAVEEARARGIEVEGPLPGDTVFCKMKGGQYDMVVAMYHDQGHIPAKLAGFEYRSDSDAWTAMSGVNVTLGLPIVRTSVDHGVAFDRAGQGRSNPQSMIQAIRLAAQLARTEIP
ncbi:4-hydroxythreonine-4-phosphate dehydrogenase PdxA [Candidatus Sumerlaeota bacterium]|nr:4-hydroxythreonine-4-phosphate dehydrogenase PdxA [Candidatus Sumerlaeota bacterium]